MNSYIGKICPFCKTEFKEGDDIVVCSSCDMPHHKDCWVENQGCSTFGCIGTIKSADNNASSVTATELQYDTPAIIFCSKCGSRHNAAMSFCTQCGAPLQRPQSAPVQTHIPPAQPYNPAPTYTPPAQSYTPPAYQQPAQNYNAYNANPYATQSPLDPDLIALIGPRADRYIPKFQALKQSGGSAGWNWAAFLFTPAWFLYRKMYGIGIALLCCSCIFGLIESPALSLLFFVAEIVLAIFANKLYLRKLEPLAQQAKGISEPFKSEFIRKNGGVSALAVVIGIASAFVFYLLAYSM